MQFEVQTKFQIFQFYLGPCQQDCKVDEIANEVLPVSPHNTAVKGRCTASGELWGWHPAVGVMSVAKQIAMLPSSCINKK